MRRRPGSLSIWGIILVSVWAIFTLSLAGWWIYFGMMQVDRLISLEHEQIHNLVRYQKMLMWEGITMAASLIGGAAGLFYYIIREYREARKLREFFAAFTHEIKTPLASARLKSEILKERMRDPDNIELVHKILADVGRLSVQLENSLFLADKESRGAFLEPVEVSSVVDSLKDLWPQLHIECDAKSVILADRRMLDTIMANIFQNALVHGHAKSVRVTAAEDIRSVTVSVCDDGKGFQGDVESLGTLFTRHYTGSGSGIGLHLVKKLTEQLSGSVRFPDSGEGFRVALTFPKAV